jgi:hypothetical protein
MSHHQSFLYGRFTGWDLVVNRLLIDNANRHSRCRSQQTHAIASAWHGGARRPHRQIYTVICDKLQGAGVYCCRVNEFFEQYNGLYYGATYVYNSTVHTINTPVPLTDVTSNLCSLLDDPRCLSLE